MKDSKLLYVLFFSYLMSFIMLVLKYLRLNPTVLSMITMNDLVMTDFSLMIFIIFISLSFSLLLCLVYYSLISCILKIITTEKVDSKYLLGTILISETFCQFIVMMGLGIIPDKVLNIFLPLVGTSLVGYLFHKKYTFPTVLLVSSVRFILYLSNWIALYLGFI